ncbi:MAG: hypothetical protein QOE14_1048 [Humisphaera sp.]|nr:hypothetical protein [Humisphaera sp.]
MRAVQGGVFTFAETTVHTFIRFCGAAVLLTALALTLVGCASSHSDPGSTDMDHSTTGQHDASGAPAQRVVYQVA